MDHNAVIERLGGYGKLMALLNAAGFILTSSSMQFKYKQSDKYTHVLIADDTNGFKLDFFNVHTRKSKEPITFRGVTLDMLRATFTTEANVVLDI